MKTNLIISHITQNKKKENKKVEKIDVAIKDSDIFYDLRQTFQHIEGYKAIYVKLFEDMSKYKFKKSASVTDNYNYSIAEFESIDLYTHTINVLKEMIKITKKPENKEHADILLLLAILHDFGKSHELCTDYNIDLNESHWRRSAKYFEIIFKDYADTNKYFNIDQTSYNLIHTTLKIHHNIVPEEKETIFLKKLIEADSAARKKEKKKIESLKKGI